MLELALVEGRTKFPESLTNRVVGRFHQILLLTEPSRFGLKLTTLRLTKIQPKEKIYLVSSKISIQKIFVKIILVV